MVMIGLELLKGRRLARVFLDLSRPDPLAEIQVPHKLHLHAFTHPIMQGETDVVVVHCAGIFSNQTSILPFSALLFSKFRYRS